MMRWAITGAAALLLGGCGGEKYPVPANAAFASVAELGYSPATNPMPKALGDLVVKFETVPADRTVRWMFAKGMDDIATVSAIVSPDGAAASEVKVTYADGAAPDDYGNNQALRTQIKTLIKPLLIEAVDAALDHRAFDMALRDQAEAQMSASKGGATTDRAVDMFRTVAATQSKRIREEAVGQKPSTTQQANPADASRPTTNLGRFQR